MSRPRAAESSAGPSAYLLYEPAHRSASRRLPPTTATPPGGMSETNGLQGELRALRGRSSCPARCVLPGRSAGRPVDRKGCDNCENHAIPSNQFAPLKGTISRRKFRPKMLRNVLLNTHRHDHAAVPIVLCAANDARAQSILEFDHDLLALDRRDGVEEILRIEADRDLRA